MHTGVVCELKLTAKPDEAVALKVNGAVPNNLFESAPKVMVWLAAIPVPVSPIVCGLPGALSVMLKLALRAPAAVGLKLTWKVVLAPGASGIGSGLEVRVKSVGWAPVVAMLFSVRDAEPELVIVIPCAAELVPTF